VLLGGQVLLLLAPLALINSDLQFYSSWDDLFGADSGTVRTPISPRGTAAPAVPRVRSSHDALTLRLPAGEGRLRVLRLLYGHSKAYRDECDLIWRLRHLPPPPANLLLTTSRTGEKDYRQTREFLALACPPADVASITLPFGGHNLTTWKRELPPALR
jgi:hypothetical protein